MRGKQRLDPISYAIDLHTVNKRIAAIIIDSGKPQAFYTRIMFAFSKSIFILRHFCCFRNGFIWRKLLCFVRLDNRNNRIDLLVQKVPKDFGTF